MRIAVTGRNGQVVQALLERGPLAGVDVVAVGRPEIDLANPAGIETALKATLPDAVISAAAYTAVDLAEREPDIAYTVNGLGAGAVAYASRRLGVPIVHLSTDYVFDGHLERPYGEKDATGPTSIYGQSKLAGEHAVAEANNNHAILRTAWIYSPFGKNFARTMLSLASTRDEVSVVDDQWGSPTNAFDIADTVICVARNLVMEPKATGLRGVFHMTSSGETNWAEFAEAIFAASRLIGGPSARVNRIPSSDYPTPAKRPLNSRLDNSRLARSHHVRLPPWQASLPPTIERLVARDFKERVPS
ncbi:dTDP-4-dehydrorhamnose reductase [Tardiphaga sp. OK246]|uniref:dTDP-4-dehydrorhamnose reductase n=1 Tax=Tardiphaga sp. OK246 TaxID=1855307 RepID=UPI000B6D2BA6|nr:dTDP-4-dehydrorhamnose reductase [Tardiphaga sp. OK246]SNT63998.1 dTDP-4-dehydrorhamnose reductase [Tardiphaga sp. OK246]